MADNKIRSPRLSSSSTASRPIIWLIGFLAFLNVYALQAVLPMVMQDFHASPVQAGLAVGATVLAVGLVSPFMGMLSDSYGRKNILCASLLFMTIPTALIPLAHRFDLLIALRFLQGLAVPGIVVVLIAYIAEEFPADRVARMMSTYVGGTIMGGFSGRFITGHAGDMLGWRGAFLVLAGINLLGALTIIGRLPASRNFVAHNDFSGALKTLRLHLANTRLMAACAVGFCVLFSLVGVFTYVNLYLAGAPFSLTSAGLANVFAVYLVGVLVTPLAARYIDRLGYMRSLQSGLAISVCGLLMTLVPSLWCVITGLAICSTGVFLCQSATISGIAKNVTQGRSLATGLYYLSYYAGGAAGSWLAGVAFESHGWAGSVLVIALAEALGAGIVTLVWSRTAQPQKQ